MQREADKGVTMTQRRDKGDHERWVRHVPKTIDVWQYVYLNCPPLTTSAAHCLQTKLCNRSTSVKMESFEVFEESPKIEHIVMDETRNIELVDGVTFRMTAIEMQSRGGTQQDDDTSVEADKKGGDAQPGEEDVDDAPLEDAVDEKGTMVVNVKASNASCVGTVTNTLTIQSNSQSTFPKTSLLPVWRQVQTGDATRHQLIKKR